MANRDKYDIMANESNGLYFSLLWFYFKAWNFKRRVKSGKISGSKIEDERVNLVNGIIPYIKKTAHVCYENYKDLLQLDSNEIVSYLKSEEIDPELFFQGYNKNINEYVSLLLFFAVHDKDKVKFDLDSRFIILKLMNGGEIDFSSLKLNKFAEESKRIIIKLLSPNFDVKNLTPYELEILDSYHEEYMDKYIYVSVTDFGDLKKRVLSEAVNLSGKK